MRTKQKIKSKLTLPEMIVEILARTKSCLFCPGSVICAPLSFDWLRRSARRGGRGSSSSGGGREAQACAFISMFYII